MPYFIGLKKKDQTIECALCLCCKGGDAKKILDNNYQDAQKAKELFADNKGIFFLGESKAGSRFANGGYFTGKDTDDLLTSWAKIDNPLAKIAYLFDESTNSWLTFNWRKTDEAA